MMILSLALAVVGTVGYNFAAKMVNHSINPFAALIAAYSTALIISVILFAITPHEHALSVYHTEHLNIAPFLIGVTLVVVDVGTVLLFRSGWPMSVGPILVSGLTAISVVVLGILVLKEGVSVVKIAGAISVLTGVVLLNR